MHNIGTVFDYLSSLSVPAESKDVPVVITAPLIDSEQRQSYACTHVRCDGYTAVDSIVKEEKQIFYYISFLGLRIERELRHKQD